MNTMSIQQTKQTYFCVPFKRTWWQQMNVEIPPGIRVVLIDGMPKVEMVVSDPANVMHGMIEGMDLQVAADRGIVRATVADRDDSFPKAF